MGFFKKRKSDPEQLTFDQITLTSGLAAIRHGKWVLRDGAKCGHTDVLYQLWHGFGTHVVPDIDPPTSVGWWIGGDAAAILRFHKSVPHHDKHVFADAESFAPGGQLHYLSFAPTPGEREFILGRIASVIQSGQNVTSLFDELGICVRINNPNPPKPVLPAAFRWVSVPDTLLDRCDERIELLYDEHIKEDNHTFLIDKVRRTSIASELGPKALITWKYDPAKVAKNMRPPRFILERDPPVENYGHLPQGIADSFEKLAGWMATEEHPYTGKKFSRPTWVHKDFREKDVWLWPEDKKLPIQMLSVEYEDRRPKVPEAPAPPPPAEALYLGMATPPPDPKPPKIDKWTTPYWEYPKPTAPAPATIPYEGRQTIYILGQPGKGKSTLMLSMFRQDVESGKGVCLIDPHGDFADLALRNIPRSRWDDVIYFDPIKCPIGIDFLRSSNALERDVLADDLYAIFKKLTEGGGERMDAILKNAFQLLLRTPGATFLDIYRLVTDPEWREATAKKYAADTLRDFWLVQYPKYPQPATSEPIISRMQRFHANQALRTITGAVSDFDFYDVIRQRKILICNLSAAYLRGETKEIIGSLLVMHLHLAALKQAALPESRRTPLYLYVDEFQTFGSSSFNEIITGARKFGLHLTLANQFLDQLTPETRDAVRIAETRFYFRLQDEDARRLGTSVGGFTADDLMNLDIGEAILRPGKPSDTRKLRIELPRDDGEDATEYVTARTLEAYAIRETASAVIRAAEDDPEPGEWPVP